MNNSLVMICYQAYFCANILKEQYIFHQFFSHLYISEPNDMHPEVNPLRGLSLRDTQAPSKSIS